MRSCDYCGSDFMPKRRDMRFCQKDCYIRAHDAQARSVRRSKPATVKPCDICGKPFILKRSDMRFCSKVCWNRARNDRRSKPAIPESKMCGQCGSEFESAVPRQGWCSATCRRRARHARVPKTGRPPHRPKTVEATCQRCKSQFLCTRRDAGFCSSCVRNDPARYQRRRARLRAAFISPVVKPDIYARDNWICQLCGVPVLQGDRWPNPMSASLDHILPLSVGGTHEPRNVQLAHLRCNIRKGNRAAFVA